MSQIFRQHLEKFIKVSDDQFNEIMGYFETRIVVKKENVLVKGKICKHHFFVLEGLLRKFYINEKEAEQTVEFAIETWWITDNIAYERRAKTEFYIQAVEKSKILYITQESQEKLVTAHPVMERYFRFVYQRAYAAAQQRIKYLFSLSKEEFYQEFIRSHPDFVQRVPQYLIASFLGFTPEYLSELRKKIVS